MEATKLWASVSEAAEALGVSATGLWKLKASGDLLPGEHWVYLTGTQGGPVGWSFEQIRQWQIEKTKACVSIATAGLLLRSTKAVATSIKPWLGEGNPLSISSTSADLTVSATGSWKGMLA